MMDAAGLIDDMWYTAESSERGTCVHALTADYDLGAADPTTVVSIHKPYLDGYVAAMRVMKPEIFSVEVPRVHPVYLYGGRLDRTVRLFGAFGVLEIKSGAPAKSHRIQTALQAILVAPEARLEPEMIGRWCLYLKPNGKWKLEDHNAEPLKARYDFHEARNIIRQVCGEGRAA